MKNILKGALFTSFFVLVVIFIGSLDSNSSNNPSSSHITPPTPSVKSSRISDYVYVKYRAGRVDIAHPRWEYLNTNRSSWVRGAWYDKNNQYMIINLKGTYYHYCSMPQSSWRSFKNASSFGSHYNAYIKGKYDCRVNPVPKYE